MGALHYLQSVNIIVPCKGLQIAGVWFYKSKVKVTACGVKSYSDIIHTTYEHSVADICISPVLAIAY